MKSTTEDSEVLGDQQHLGNPGAGACDTEDASSSLWLGFGKWVHSLWGSGLQVGHEAQKVQHSVEDSGLALQFP